MSVKYRGRLRRKKSVRELPITKDELMNCLSEHGLDKFFIEHHAYFSNHLSQASIALYHLGAPREKFSKFVEHYLDQLERADGPTRRVQDLDTNFESMTMEELKGKRIGYYKIRQYYHILWNKTYANSHEDLLRKEFPKLALGISANIMHCLENIGYALNVSNGELVCDGMAYLHHSFCPNFMTIPRDISQLGKGQLSIIEVFEKLREDVELYNFLRREKNSEWVLRKKLNPVQNGLIVLLQKRADSLMDYAYMIKVSNEILRNPENLTEWLTDQMILIFQATSVRNDYYLLHASTSTWALGQLLNVFDCDLFKMELIRVHLLNLLALYIVQGCPKLDKHLLEVPNIDYRWEKLLEAVLDMPINTDEHVYKFAHVCYVRGMKTKDIRISNVCKRAVRTVIESDRFHK